MLDVKNKKVISKLSKRTRVNSKVRNIFAILAIGITTFMISMICLFAFDIWKQYENMNLRTAGIVGDAVLQYPSETQINQISEVDYITKYGVSTQTAITEKAGRNNKLYVSYFYVDQSYFEMQKETFNTIKGTYPQNADEIMLSEWALRRLGIENPVIGMEIPLNYRTDVTKEQDSESKLIQCNFRLSGYYVDNTLSDYTNDMAIAYVSKDFQQLSGNQAEMTGTLSMKFDSMLKSSEYIFELTELLNLQENQTLRKFINIEMTSEKLMTVMGAIIIIFLVMLSGYLLIYNIFYLSVTRDIRFYGLLKTIGTTPKQLAQIIKKQAIFLSAIGISIGIAVSGVVYSTLFPILLKLILGDSGIYIENITHFEIWPYIIAFVFTAATIIISVRKPAKTVSTITPVEAIRYLNGDSGKSQKERKSYGGGKIYKMAFRNVFRDKKRALVVFCSMFLGITVFTIILTMVESIDSKKFSEYGNITDIKLSDRGIQEGNSITEELQKEIKKILGVTAVYSSFEAFYLTDYSQDVFKGYSNIMENIYDFTMDKEKAEYKFGASIIGYDKELFKLIRKSLNNGKDEGAFTDGTGVLISNEFKKNNWEPDSFLISLEADEKEMELSVDGFIKNEVSISGDNEAPMLYMEKSGLEKLTSKYDYESFYISVSPDMEKEVLDKITNLIDGKDIYIRSKSGDEAMMGTTLSIIRILGLSISIILAFVGVVNFINIMFTGIFVRKQELSVMESIGMTKKQVYSMLRYEGLYYLLISAGAAMTIGNALLYVIYKLSLDSVSFAVFDYPVIAVGAIVLIVGAVCLIVPGIAFSQFEKEELPSRLRTD